MDALVLIDQAVAQGKIKPALAKRIRGKSVALTSAVERVEKASALRYPPYYVEPSLPVATSQIEYGSVGALYARVIPAAFEGRLSIIVQFTAPLLLFGLRSTLEAVSAHEFMHYVDLVRRLSRMQVTSDERSSTLFESGYADEERVVDPALLFPADKKLVAAVKRKFAGGLVDEKLNEKVARNWIDKGLPTRRVAPEENSVSIGAELVARSKFDPMVLAKIERLVGRQG